MKTIVCYGDSNTHGHRPPDGGRFSYEERWTGRLQLLLGEQVQIIEEGLNGRTTVWEDPIEGFKSGKSYLIPCLYTHKPIDIFVLMLGTNDLKRRFSLGAADIANGCGTLVQMIQSVTPMSQGFVPRILLISPMIVPASIDDSPFGGIFDGASCYERSRQFSALYAEIAQKYGCDFLDAARYVSPSEADHLHLDAKGHEIFAKLLSEKLRDML